jgi:hypothetical protein
VKWLARGGRFDVMIEGKRAAFVLRANHAEDQEVVRMGLLGSRGWGDTEGMRPTGGASNYFIGDNPDKWRTGIPHYGAVRIRNVYDKIDLVYCGNDRDIEYDFVLQPGANPDKIEVFFEGIEGIQTSRDGSLRLRTPSGKELLQKKARVYQTVGGRQVEIAAEYRVRAGNRVQFALANYDRTKPLVIDPVLAYSTYFGGSGNEGGYNDVSNAGIAVDSTGSVYVSGYTYSADYPRVGGVQGDPDGNDLDAVITKLSPSGNTVVYSTYLGGNGPDKGAGIAVDSTGAAYVTGYTYANNFPTVNPIHGDRVHREAFVTKLSPAGNSIVYSTYLGGDNDDRGSGIAVDSTGSAYVTGTTYSTDFPTANAVQPARNGAYSDAFVSKLNPAGNGFVYSTYLGGNAWDDQGLSIAIDATGAAYVAGNGSGGFPVVNPIQTTPSWAGDIFIAKLTAAGTIAYGTLYGGNDTDSVAGIAVDSAGSAYFAMSTRSPDLALVNSFQPYGGNGDVYVAKLNTTGNAFVWATYLGGSNGDQARAVAVDAVGSLWVTGSTGSTNFPVQSPYQASRSAGQDAFLTQFAPNGQSLLFSTYFGGGTGGFFGSPQAEGQAVTVDAAGSAYFMGTTGSTSGFPLLNPVQTTGQSGEFFIAKFNVDNLNQVTISPTSVTMTAAGGSGTVTVTATGSWSATSTAAWITVNSPSGTVSGSGTVSYTVAPNPLGAVRSGSINIGGNTFNVVQNPASFLVSPLSIPLGAAAGSATVTVTPVPATASWTATSNAAWLTVISPAGLFTGPGTVDFQALANTSTGSRTGTLTIAGQTVTVTQASSGVEPIVTTIAGRPATGQVAVMGDGGPGTSSDISAPRGIAVDAAGNIYFASYGCFLAEPSRIRKLTPAGIISTLAGVGTCGSGGDGGLAVNASLNYPSDVALDPAGNIYIADTHNGRIRKINAATGIITTIAGNSMWGYSGDGGPATNATLYYPHGVDADGAGNVYIADHSNHRIRRVNSAGIISTIAGTGACGSGGDGGPATAAQFCYPTDVVLDGSGGYYVADLFSQRIRHVSSAGVITTVAGTGATGYSGDGGPATAARLNTPTSLSRDAAGNLYIADNENYVVRKVDTSGIISTVAGNGTSGFSGDGGPATLAQFAGIWAVAVDAAGSLYITSGGRVRKVGPPATPVDTTPPTITYVSRTASNGNGWNNTNVIVTWSCTDAGSGVVASTVTQTVSTEGANQSVTGTCTDNAGNVSTNTQTGINIDKTNPTATYVITPAPNGAGWFNTPVTVSFSGADGLSGPAGCSSQVTLTADGAGQTASGICSDLAGNTTPVVASGINIDRTAPVVTTVSLAPMAIAINTTATLSATLTDAGGSQLAGADYQLNAAAATLLTAASGSSASVNATVGPFATPGVHEYCVTARDVAGNTSAPQCILLAVYNPNGGFVTGAGWIQSPAGAFPENPSATGKAHFGFQSQYQNGANTPTGNTSFRFKDGNLKFESTAYEWLVVAGARAQFKGVGTIDGQPGTFQFMLTAIDGQINGGGGVDKFRIKITGSNGVVYDNQPGGSDQANPTTALGAGVITIHP